MASVTIRDVHKSFGTTEVIHGINIDIADGKFVVLVGPSGCGKSTLLRMIAGLESITEGEVHIDDEVMNYVPPKERDIAMVFQNYALYPHMKVFDNMAFSLKISKTPVETINERVSNAATILNLTEYLDRYPRQLSGGQRQRVAMGRAIVRDPKVFLFDEPLSNLDARLRVQMRTEIKSLHQRLKVTSVYVTHDQIEAMTMADSIVVMNDGEIAQIGPPLELYDYPANLFVAGFIGSPAMNLIHGQIDKNAKRAGLVVKDGTKIALPNECPGDHGQRVVLGARPEHFHAVDGTANYDGSVSMDIEVIEPTGSETVIIGTGVGGPLQWAIRERTALRPGQRIKLRPDPEAMHYFDESTGNRLA